jgi:hypothetical protein
VLLNNYLAACLRRDILDCLKRGDKAELSVEEKLHEFECKCGKGLMDPTKKD